MIGEKATNMLFPIASHRWCKGQWKVRGKTVLSFITALWVSCTFVSCGGGNSGSAPSSEPVLKFAIMGDTSLGAADSSQYPSSCNIPQLKRTIRDIASLSTPPAISFLTGDLVLNFADDQGQTLAAELDAWQAAYLSMWGADHFELVPLVGNHESDIYDVVLNAQYPNPSIYAVWMDWIARNRYDRYAGSGPTPSGDNPDFLVKDERYFSYSFTLKGVCFIIVNTDTLSSILDPATSKPYAGWIPLHWIEDELIRAQANASVSHIFVIGHRPIEAPSWTTQASSTPILNNAAYPLATGLANAMKSFSKVRGYIGSHVHAQDMTRLQGGAGVWQIVSGNAGAPFDSNWDPAGGKYFGFMVVNVYGGGTVSVVNYWRPAPPEPQKYYEESPVPPPAAVPGAKIIIN